MPLYVCVCVCVERERDTDIGISISCIPVEEHGVFFHLFHLQFLSAASYSFLWIVSFQLQTVTILLLIPYQFRFL